MEVSKPEVLNLSNVALGSPEEPQSTKCSLGILAAQSHDDRGKESLMNYSRPELLN